MAPRLLIVSTMRPSPSAPQFGVFVARQAQALEGLGAEVEFVGNTGTQSGLRHAPRKYGGLALAARRAVRRQRPDAIVAHFLVPAGIIARSVAPRETPYILVAHGQDVTNAESVGALRRLTQRALDGASALVVVAPDLEARLRAVCRIDCPVHVIDMGVDLTRFHPGDRDIAAHALGPEPSRPLVVQVGNLIERKNPVRLAAAVARLRERHGGAELWIAGQGPLAAALQDMEHVRLLGAVEPDVVPRLLRAADCAALVSLREGYGLGAIEAVGCGVPLVVSERAPVAADVPAGAGILVDPESVDAIADGLERALRLPRDSPEGQCAAADHDVRRQAARLLAVAAAVSRPR